ncbi:GPI-GlcNAc transferase complex, PIG-H component-domain-containing protein [Phascolomyces articulosus]|uniref:GPI-GlcNAc transferase complex, PIG-H component-domain-containing protein n=1 Tax=Phascolomyces articulosus TaxID=60185 RepID=A0AAD5PL47_9FUNG|nr:GPI-GlcNAc transferase complex, PIG-H component-domain-containing protein [Phascolomyces articulosus]
MYIQYEHTQWYFTERRNEKEYGQNDSLIKRVPDKLPKPEFMPSKLVRISDMKVVHGSRVNEGYCALSYSWNQSGGILRQRGTRKCKRIDEGHHKIIFPSTNSFSPSEEKTPDKNTILPEDVIPYARTHKNAKLDKIRRVLTIIHNVNYLAKKEEYNRCVKYVKFEGLIRQICRQFNIKYIWYDQVCINQNDKLEKQREIRNMHHIFSNAYCTVALVPEFYLQQNKNQYPNYKDFEITKSTLHQHEWFKRLWTLEEAIKSKRLLFIGRNIHLFLSMLNDNNHRFLILCCLWGANGLSSKSIMPASAGCVAGGLAYHFLPVWVLHANDVLINNNGKNSSYTIANLTCHVLPGQAREYTCHANTSTITTLDMLYTVFSVILYWVLPIPKISWIDSVYTIDIPENDYYYGLCVLLIWLWLKSHTVKEESILAIREIGIQVRTVYWGGRSVSKFIDQHKIDDIIINEGITMWQIKSYMAILVKNQDRMVVVFEHLLPRLRPVLLDVYWGTRAVIFPHQTQLLNED